MHCAQVARMGWRVAATRRNASQSAVLPMPASPVTKTTCRCAPDASSSAPSSRAISGSRPTKMGDDELADRSTRGVDDGGDEDVTALDEAPDELGTGRVVAERPANLADEHLDVVWMDVGLGPDARQERLPGDDVAGALDEHGEHVEGLVGERNPNLIPPEASAAQVQREGRKIFHVSMSRPGHCDRNRSRVHGWSDYGGEILPKSYRPHDNWRSYRALTVIQPLPHESS